MVDEISNLLLRAENDKREARDTFFSHGIHVALRKNLVVNLPCVYEYLSVSILSDRETFWNLASHYVATDY